MNRNTCQNMTSFSRNRQGIETSPSGFRTGQPACQMRQGAQSRTSLLSPQEIKRGCSAILMKSALPSMRLCSFWIRIPLTRMPFSISEPAARFGITRWRNTRKRTVPLPSTRPMMPRADPGSGWRSPGPGKEVWHKCGIMKNDCSTR